MRTRPSGPEGAVRPFQPDQTQTEAPDQIADAIDKIAISLASIDHNLEVLTNQLAGLEKTPARLAEMNAQLKGLAHVVARKA